MQRIQTRLAILDREIGEGLSTYLMLHGGSLQPVLCDSPQMLFRSGAPIGLVGASYYQEVEEAKAVEGMQIFWLGEGQISPYQPADALIRELYRQAMERQIFLPGALRTLGHDKELIAVCSPHGYDQQTAFAVVYSLLRSEQVRTLYLDFMYYNGFFDISDKNVGDLMYELHKQTQPISHMLPAFVRICRSLDYIPPVRVQMDLEDLTGEDFTQLLQQLLQDSEYGLIVVNLPCRPSFLRAVYDSCSCMYSLQREGALYDRAQARLLEDLGWDPVQTGTSHLEVIPMPAISGSFSLDESMYEELLFGEMAAFIRKYLDTANGSPTS